MSNNTLVQLIYGALKSQNNEQRKQAQKQLVNIRQSNPNQFFIQCSVLLLNQKQDDFIRQSASTLLVNSLRTKQNNIYFWDLLELGTRQSVKSQLLNTLIDPNPMIMKSGANVISHIAAIQISRNQWLDIVDILAQNTGYNDVNIRKASIITIGNICQQFHQAAVTIETRACQQFLGGIIIGLQEKDDISIVEQSMKALRNSLSFLKIILNQEIYRNQVFRIIYQKINIGNDERLPYQALFQFCKNCYEYLQPYLPSIMQLVANNLKRRNENTLLALQLLDTIGTEYQTRVQDAQDRTNNNRQNLQNYLLPLQDEILPQIMKCLLIQNQYELDLPQLRNSAAKTLSTFASIGNRQTVDLISNGAAACLQEQNLGRQQATAILLSALCQNKDTEYVVQIITNAFQHVLKLLNSNTQIVVANTLNGFILISQFFPFLFYKHPNISKIIKQIFQLINPSKMNITTAVMIILKNITENIQPNCIFLTQPSILLTKIVNIHEKFLDNYEGVCKDYAQKSVLVIMNCLVRLKNRQTVLFMIEFLINKYYFYYDRKVQDQLIRLSSLASVIHTCILALQNIIPPEGLINNLCILIDKHLSLFGIEQQGLNMISGMAISFNIAFESRTQKYWKYLEEGLRLITQPKTFNAALCSVGDFSRVYAQTFISKELNILQKLLILLHEITNREIKLNILKCIADLLLGLGQSAEPYLSRIIQMVNFCFQAIHELSNNPNQRQYVEELKSTLLDMYTCLTFSINGKGINNSQLLFNHFPMLVKFVVKTCERKQNPTIDYVKLCLYLIYDTVNFYWRYQHARNTLKTILQSKQIKDLVKLLKNFMQRDYIKQLQELIQTYDRM